MNNNKLYFRFCTLCLIFSILFLSPLAAKTTTYTKLSGTPIGSPSYQNQASCDKDKAFDGDFNTFFDSDFNTWVGLDLGTPKVVTLVKYAPRAGFAFRIQKSQIQASNNADFSGAVTLWTIPTIPEENTLTSANLYNGVAYRYIRLLRLNDACSISELEFYEGTDGLNLIPHTMMTATTSSEQPGSEGSMALDDNTATIWHINWDNQQPLPQSITLHLSSTFNVEKLIYLPRQDGIANGIITSYNIYVSMDGVDFGSPVVAGEWAADATEKSALFTGLNANYIKLEATAGGGNWASAAEINLIGVQTSVTDVHSNANEFDSKFNAYQSGSSIVADLTGFSGQQTLTVFDVQGKSLFTRIANGGEKIIISNALKTGVYLIKVQGSEKTIMAKLILR